VNFLFCRSSGISLRGCFGFVLAALWPSPQLAIIAGRFRLALAGDFPPASGTVADHLDFVDGAFHGVTIPDTLGYSERIRRAQKISSATCGRFDCGLAGARGHLLCRPVATRLRNTQKQNQSLLEAPRWISKVCKRVQQIRA